MEHSNSTYLFSLPGFLRGFARALDLGATFDAYNKSDSPEAADRRALTADWAQVGNDLVAAMDQYERAE